MRPCVVAEAVLLLLVLNFHGCSPAPKKASGDEEEECENPDPSNTYLQGCLDKCTNNNSATSRAMDTYRHGNCDEDDSCCECCKRQGPDIAKLYQGLAFTWIATKASFDWMLEECVSDKEDDADVAGPITVAGKQRFAISCPICILRLTGLNEIKAKTYVNSTRPFRQALDRSVRAWFQLTCDSKEHCWKCAERSGAPKVPGSWPDISSFVQVNDTARTSTDTNQSLPLPAKEMVAGLNAVVESDGQVAVARQLIPSRRV